MPLGRSHEINWFLQTSFLAAIIWDQIFNKLNIHFALSTRNFAKKTASYSQSHFYLISPFIISLLLSLFSKSNAFDTY